jgi:mRNA interferase RelE/StbE
MPKARSVNLSREAEKSLKRLEAHHQELIIAALQALGTDPLIGKASKGKLAGRRSFRVGMFRIVYTFAQESIGVSYIAHRKDVYR